MKTIADIARDAIIAFDLVPTENVGIENSVDADWDGVTRILIAEGETVIDEYQFGAMSQTTPLTIYCLSADRNTAIEVCQKASGAAFRAVELLERKRGSGILAITRNTANIRNIPDRTEFEASRSFNVLNTINSGE